VFLDKKRRYLLINRHCAVLPLRDGAQPLFFILDGGISINDILYPSSNSDYI
jgi:hypothetical protein